MWLLLGLNSAALGSRSRQVLAWPLILNLKRLKSFCCGDKATQLQQMVVTSDPHVFETSLQGVLRNSEHQAVVLV